MRGDAPRAAGYAGPAAGQSTGAIPVARKVRADGDSQVVQLVRESALRFDPRLLS